MARKTAKKTPLAELAQAAGEECIEALLDEVRTGKGASRITAAKTLLERGFGRGVRPSETTGEATGNEKIDPKADEANPVIAAALSSLRSE
jgi:hypothetical protein